MFFLEANIQKQRSLGGSDPAELYVPLNAGRRVGANSKGNTGSFNAIPPAEQVEMGEWIQNRLDDSTIDLTTAGTLSAAKVTGITLVTTDNSGTYTYSVVPTSPDSVYLVDAALGVGTLNLPAAANYTGYKVTVKKIDSGVNLVTLDGDGAETIEGAGTFTSLDAQYDVVTILCDGTEWFVVSSLIA